MVVWIPGPKIHRFWQFHFSVYSLIFLFIEKITQTLKTVFHQLSKHLKFHQKYSAAHHIFNCLLSAWISWWNTVYHVWYVTSRLQKTSVLFMSAQKPLLYRHCLLSIALCYLLHVKGTFYLAPCYYRLLLLQTLNKVPKCLSSIFHKLFPLSNSSLSNMQFFPFHFNHNYWARGSQRIFQGGWGGGGWNC